MNQCRHDGVLVSNVLETGFMRNVQPEFMNEVNLFVRKIRWVRPEIKVLNLFGRRDHAEAYALLRLVRQSFPRLAKWLGLLLRCYDRRTSGNDVRRPQLGCR